MSASLNPPVVGGGLPGQPTTGQVNPPPSPSDNKELFALVLQLQSTNPDTVSFKFGNPQSFFLSDNLYFTERKCFV